MSWVLVMGGTTFVSRCLSEYLISRGYRVDILTRGQKLPGYNGYREHLVCDRRSKDQLRKVLKNKAYEYVFDISGYTRNDVELLTGVLNTDALKKYIFCSSGSVYRPCHTVMTEESPRGENPHWGQYGLAKMEAEDYLLEMHKKTGFPVTIFRPTYIYGEHNNLYRESHFFERIIGKKTIPYPHGNNTRIQFIHIDDLIRVFESAMYHAGSGKAYNVTRPQAITWEELIRCCSEAAGIEAIGKPVDVHKVTYEARTYFPFRDVTYLLDITKLINDGLHMPCIELREGLERAYRWYRRELPRLTNGRMSRVDEV